MPADTITEMVLGFLVIISVLVVYILLLAARIKRARAKNDLISENHLDS
ncbi:MAG: hypothetical protein RQ728_06790 [Brevefilum sp.]|nr:hypothetical protein [Brevefilum sp.]MDT8381948.1 hypothetical protein [Brevefilum sp.]MDW7754714.1 hypothetical protein [Brevefilum sp.]